MPYPNFKNKYKERALFSPKDYFFYHERRGNTIKVAPPQGVIFCYSSLLLKYILENHKVKRTSFFGDRNMMADGEMYMLTESRNKVALAGRFGIGAPAVIPLCEELIEWGVKRFISIGTAGTLQPGISIGDLVVCERAIRDEGTSHHYIKPSKYASSSKQLTKKLEMTLDELGQPYIRGTSWTIDAVYRETIAEARQYRKEGVITVEMEAAALFAVAQYRKVQMSAMFTISDILGEKKWQPHMHHKQTKAGLETLYKAAVKTLLSA